MRDFESWEELHEAEMETVYISYNQIIEGDDIKYHSSPCCGGIKNRDEISKLEAEDHGYSPCSACYE